MIPKYKKFVCCNCGHSAYLRHTGAVCLKCAEDTPEYTKRYRMLAEYPILGDDKAEIN